MTTARNEVFSGLQHKNFYIVVGEWTFGGGGGLLGGIFPVAEDENIV